MPSNLGGFGDLAIFRSSGVKNDPKKKVSKCVWGYFTGVFMMFPDGFDEILGPLDPNFGPDHPA